MTPAERARARRLAAEQSGPTAAQRARRRRMAAAGGREKPAWRQAQEARTAELEALRESDPAAFEREIQADIAANKAAMARDQRNYRLLQGVEKGLQASQEFFDGFSVGTMDEIASGLQAAGAGVSAAVRGQNPAIAGGLSWMETQGRLADSRQDFREDHPVTATGLQIAGGVTSAVGTSGGGLAARGGAAGGRAAPTAVQRALQAATGNVGRGVATRGAAGGGLYGFFGSEGGVRERAIGGAAGAALGAAGAKGLQVAGRAARPVARQVGRAFQNSYARAMEAVRAILADNGVTSAQLREIADEADRLGAMRTTADPEVGGQGALAAAATFGARGGQAGQVARDTAMDLAEGRPQRIEDAVTNAIGVPRDAIEGNLQRALDRMRADARPRYQAAFQAPFEPTDRLRELVKVPIINRALRRGRDLAQSVAIAEGRDAPPGQMMILKEGEKTEPARYTVLEMFDQAKRILDDQYEVALARGDNTEAFAIESARQAMVKELDAIVPDLYAEARQFGGEAPILQSAFEFGKKAAGGSGKHGVDQLAAEFGRIAPDGQLTAKQSGIVAGFVKALTEKLDQRGTSPGFFQSPGMRKKMRTLFGPRLAEDLQAFLSAERSTAVSASRFDPNVGSATAMRSQGDEGAQLVDEGIDVITRWAAGGNPVGIVADQSRKALRALNRGLSQLSREEQAMVTELLVSDPRAVAEALDAAGTSAIGRAQRAGVDPTLAAAIGGRAGGLAGQNVTPTELDGRR